jgi:methylmalonyl-CoA mutase C-terminal domain/subunit
MNRKARILIGKVGLDGHDVGARVVARALADAGMEVIYTGLRQTPQQIVTAALEEAADAIGISILSGAHLTLRDEIARLLNEHQAGDIPLIAGGIISVEDIPDLKKMGVREIFLPASPTDEIAEFSKIWLSNVPRTDARTAAFFPMQGWMTHQD